jgi:hypothetical protein
MTAREEPFPGTPSQCMEAGFCPGCGGTGRVERSVPVDGTYVCSSCNGGGTMEAMRAALTAMALSDQQYLYDDHGHDVTDPDCIKCWMRIAHQAQLAHSIFAEEAGETIRMLNTAVDRQSNRLLRILQRASNVVEISWSVPEQEPGSLLDTLLAATKALEAEIRPPEKKEET